MKKHRAAAAAATSKISGSLRPCPRRSSMSAGVTETGSDATFLANPATKGGQITVELVELLVHLPYCSIGVFGDDGFDECHASSSAGDGVNEATRTVSQQLQNPAGALHLPVEEKCIQSFNELQSPPQDHPISANAVTTTSPEKIIPGRTSSLST